MDNRRIGKIGY